MGQGAWLWSAIIEYRRETEKILSYYNQYL